MLRSVVACLGLCSALAAQATGLAELARVARERSEAQRPAQLAALAPYLQDLALRYRDNRELLDKRIAQVAELGDAIVPLLLEKLVPADGSQEARNLAENSARVLAHLDPGSFVDALLELIDSQDETTRRSAVRLLGRTGERAATRALARVLPKLPEAELLEALDALTQLGHPEAAEAAATRLTAGSVKVREAALGYLTRAKSPAGADAALAKLATEPDAVLALHYARYFASTTPGHAGAADLLVRYLQHSELDVEQQAELVRALARIAPPEHAATVQGLERIVESGEPALAIDAAVALRDLGEKRGLRLLFDRLDDAVAKRKREAQPWEQRGDAFVAIGKLPEAARDYEEATKHARGSAMLRAALWLKIARCEARRGRWAQFRRAVNEGQLTRGQLEREARIDREFAQALEDRAIQRFLEGLPK
jgi:hypothetical protein